MEAAHPRGDPPWSVAVRLVPATRPEQVDVDVAVAGAGTCADEFCAVSATASGDAFFRLSFGCRVANLFELDGMALEDAAGQALREVQRVKGVGGCIAIDADGELACPFNSPHMARGWVVEDAPLLVGLERSQR